MEPTVGDVTDVLRLAAGGDTEAQDRLFQLLVPALRQMAAARMARERPGHTLSPTALVNEAFLRLAKQEKVPAANTAQLLGVFGITMRRVLVDHWKKKHAAKSGGGWDRVEFDQAAHVGQADGTADEVGAHVLGHRVADHLPVEQVDGRGHSVELVIFNVLRHLG